MLALQAAGRSIAALEVAQPLARPFDAVVVLGCPSAPDGALSPCQASRATWAAILWERGAASRFIVSGAAVHTPYVEAEALAAAMAALGVPADRILLEPDALHTDENAYNAVRIARALDLGPVAFASQKGHAALACRMAMTWHRPCGAISVDADAVRARLDAGGHDALAAVRARRVPDSAWRSVADRERARARDLGRRPRPPSVLLYVTLGIREILGADPWIPPAPREVPIVTWAERREALASP